MSPFKHVSQSDGKNPTEASRGNKLKGCRLKNISVNSIIEGQKACLKFVGQSFLCIGKKQDTIDRGTLLKN